MPELKSPKPLAEFISPLGFTAPELPDIESFHEASKLKSYHGNVLGQRIGVYLTDPRAVRETASNYKHYVAGEQFDLPPPPQLATPLGDLLSARSSHRNFSGASMSVVQLSAILSSVRVNRTGLIPGDEGLQLRFRPYPSGGGLYPSEIYVVARMIDGIPPAVLHYDALHHSLTRIANIPPLTGFMADMSDTEGMLLNASAVFLVTSLFERTVVKYSYRGYRFALMEAGMIPLMLNLSATAVGVGALHWGGYMDDRINAILGVDGVSETVSACLIVGGDDSE